MRFDVKTYVRTWGKVLGDSPNAGRIAKQSGILTAIGVSAAANAGCMALDRLFYSDFQQQEIRTPLFVLGNPRSGTTFLHRLLSCDEERFMSFRGWEIALPSVVQKNTVNALQSGIISAGRALSQLLGEPEVLRNLRKMHPLAMNEPEEDDFLHVIPFTSSALAVAFPYMESFPQLYECFDEQSDDRRKSQMNYYSECVQRQLYVDSIHGGRERTLLSKNPVFVCKLRSLLETFSDARFVYLLRDPRESILSTVSLMRFLWRQIGISDENIKRGLRRIVRDCTDDYHYAMKVLPSFPNGQWSVVRYPELISDPTGTVERLYSELGLDLSAAYASRLTEAVSDAKEYKSEHHYCAEDLGVDIEAVLRDVADVYTYWDLPH